MPKAWLTGRSWSQDHGYYSDPPHWEERMFGERHRFCTWYHNNIRYGLLHWGPIGWVTVSFNRLKANRWLIPRCRKCRRVLWPWVIPISAGGRASCQPCCGLGTEQDGSQQVDSSAR